MKLLSRLFHPAPSPPATAVVEPPLAAEPAPPAVDPAEQQQLLQAIDSGSMDPTELMRLAVEGQTTRLRQAAASRIQDPASWQALLPHLRGRDKAAYKLLKGRLDSLLAEQRALVQVRNDAEALCASIEKHAAKPHDALFASTLSMYIARWQSLPPGVDDAVRQRGQQALDRGQEVIAAHERDLALLAAEQAAERLRASELEAAQLAQQQAAEARAAAEESERAAADQAREVAALAETQALGEKQSADTQAHAEIASLIRLCGAALGRGETRKSARFRQSIESAMAAAPSLPPHLTRNLEQLDTRLNELRQWKDYVAAPKRIELIEEVEALIGADETPASLVDHLRALRQEWRTINKGLAVDAVAEAERFEQAFKTAFQPCQVYLNEQAALRRTNLDARKQVLDRVLAFEAGLDAEQPDHALIMRVLREAPQEWRGHAPVDRDASRPLDADFFSALDRLRARVAAWHAANAADKQALIARAAQLAATADVGRAIEEVKHLQAQWKTTGPVPNAQSQAMWEEFRALCNAVYERRQQESAQHSATLGQARSAALELCTLIEKESQGIPADRATGEARLREWQQAFHALGEFPRGDARALHERYQRAMNRYESQLAGIAQRDAEAVEQNALTAARHVRAYQRAVIEGDAARDELKTAAEAFIAGVPRWPSKGILQALRQSLTLVESREFAETDDAARERALRKLCIHAEILSGTTTPPEDAGLRREHELQLLQKGLGQARQADDRVWDAMRIEWLGLGAAEARVHDDLENRFMRCLKRRAR
jgi:hypothetical protein